MKEEIKQLRQEIAALEQEQIAMKAQRKTVNLKVERTVNPYEAVDAVRNNRHKLRLMYVAYGLMRGKTFNKIENSYDKKNNDIHPLYSDFYCREINKILRKYGYEMECEKVKTWWGETEEYKEGCDEKIVRIGEQQA